MPAKNPQINLAQILNLLMKNKSKSNQTLIILLVVVVIVGLIWFLQQQQPQQQQTNQQQAPAVPGDYLFCFWNVENLFDDENNPKDLSADREFDDWFSSNPDDRNLKLKKHTEVLMALNNGKGPDIIGLAEVESERAAELLRKALNERIADEKLHYQHILMKEVASGRHIAPVIITRLPVVADRTTQPGGKLKRIVKGHIKMGDRELVVIVSHWRSRVEQGNDTGEEQRGKYADQIYGEFKGMYLSNPKVDVLVCGDFNDDPDDISVTQHLHATGELGLVRPGVNMGYQPGTGNPFLFNLMAGKDPKIFGTLYHARWHIFDQIVVSPGMLDEEGWACKPDSVQTIKKLTGPDGQTISLINPKGKIGQPWNFGRQKDYTGNPAARGYSDHFPVTVMLTLKGVEKENEK